MHSDRDLVIKASQGEIWAEEALAKRYNKLVRICARQFFLVGGDGEDLIQEGMLGLLNAIRRYDVNGKASFKTFAERCIKNRLLTVIESANRLKNAPLNEGVSLEAMEESDSVGSMSEDAFTRMPEEIILQKELQIELREEYAKCLSKYEIDVLRLFLDGASYQEIARCLNKTEKSVDNAVQRIRRKFATQS